MPKTKVVAVILSITIIVLMTLIFTQLINAVLILTQSTHAINAAINVIDSQTYEYKQAVEVEKRSKPVVVQVEIPAKSETTVIQSNKKEPINLVDLGEFEITYYTAGKESTGKSPGHPQYGITKSGATVWEGLTVAVDPSVIPLGSYIYIEGIGIRMAQDTGSAIKGKDVDVYVKNLSDIPEVGRHKAKVYLLEPEG